MAEAAADPLEGMDANIDGDLGKLPADDIFAAFDDDKKGPEPDGAPAAQPVLELPDSPEHRPRKNTLERAAGLLDGGRNSKQLDAAPLDAAAAGGDGGMGKTASLSVHSAESGGTSGHKHQKSLSANVGGLLEKLDRDKVLAEAAKKRKVQTAEEAHKNLLSNTKRWKHDVVLDDDTGIYFHDVRNKKARRVVFVDMKVRRLGDIDTSKETFRCIFHYYLTWLATRDDVVAYMEYMATHKEKEGLGWKPRWQPGIEWTNAVEVHEWKQSEPFKIKPGTKIKPWDVVYKGENMMGFDPNFGRWIRCKWECDVSFAEELELECFPLDCQDFTMYMKNASENTKKCDILPIPRTGEFFLMDPEFSVLAEWEVENTLIEFSTTDPSKSKSASTYPVMQIHIKCSRRWVAHVGHIMITACMFMLGICAFALKRSFLGERLSYCVTLLLADVATLQLMYVQLPQIPYWTLMDGYMYTCFFFLFLIIIWSALLSADDWFEEHDTAAGFFFGGIVAIVNVGAFAAGVYFKNKEREKLFMSQDDLEEMFEERRGQSDRRAISNEWASEVLQTQCQDEHKTLTFQGGKNQVMSQRDMKKLETQRKMELETHLSSDGYAAV